MRPLPEENSRYYDGYIAQVQGNDFIQALAGQHSMTQELLKSIPAGKEGFAYAEGKWTLKQVVLHIIDCERVFQYRSLSIARSDQTHLPGFDENIWADNDNSASRNLADIAQEFKNVRQASLDMYRSFSPEVLLRTGMANGHPVSVRATGFIMAGHELHHLQVIRERYL